MVLSRGVVQVFCFKYIFGNMVQWSIVIWWSSAVTRHVVWWSAAVTRHVICANAKIQILYGLPKIENLSRNCIGIGIAVWHILNIFTNVHLNMQHCAICILSKTVVSFSKLLLVLMRLEHNTQDTRLCVIMWMLVSLKRLSIHALLSLSHFPHEHSYVHGQ